VTIPGFGGTLLRPDENGYDAARAVWNAMHDRQVKAIYDPENTFRLNQNIKPHE
jgi:hypothetical protein